MHFVNLAVSVVLALIIASCSNPATAPNLVHPLIANIDINSIDGNFRLLLTDAPTDKIKKIDVTFFKIEVINSQKRISILPQPKTFDLLALRNGKSTQVLDFNLPLGKYSGINVEISQVILTLLDGTKKVLSSMDSLNQKIRLSQAFSIDNDAALALVIDIDAEKSLSENSKGGFKFQAMASTAAIVKKTGEQINILPVNSKNTAIADSSGILVDTFVSAPPTSGGSSNPTPTYTVGGTVNGLGIGKTIVLWLYDHEQSYATGSAVQIGSDKSITTNGAYTFSLAPNIGMNYALRIRAYPSGQHCEFENDTITMGPANVSNLNVDCEDAKVIFLSNRTFTGDMNGTVGLYKTHADSNCSADAVNLGLRTEYLAGSHKAMLVDGTNRKACTGASCGGSNATDWVLASNTAYMTLSENVPEFIGTTTASAIFQFEINSAWSEDAEAVWTGLDAAWGSADANCTGWTSSNSSDLGSVGSSSDTNETAIFQGNESCDSAFHLVCVEQ
jgi:Protein of unknown function (DUF1554)/Domain of unknown function (DUF4382)